MVIWYDRKTEKDQQLEQHVDRFESIRSSSLHILTDFIQFENNLRDRDLVALKRSFAY